VDALSDVLRVLQLSGALLFRAELAAPWSFAMPHALEMAPLLLPGAGRLVRFHVIVGGECLVQIDGEVIRLGPGSVILLPRGDAHVMCSATGVPAVPVMKVLPALNGDRFPCLVSPGSGPTTTVLCGFLGCDEPIFDPLLTALPQAITERSDGSASWFGAMVEHMARGGDGALSPGERAMQTKLVEVMFLEVVRRHIAALPAREVGWLAGLRDACVGRAVSELHANPSHDWTVGELARRVGVSRSTLAERFRSVAGIAPMRYLAAWRLQVASGLLRRTDVSIAETAARVGYQSEGAFHRAFKRLVGQSPAAWREKARGKGGANLTA
jgi:AraC-like DNA-binding protein